MGGYISKIGPHVYVKGSAEAARLYKEAFRLEDKGKPILDADGNIWHHVLARDGENIISLSEDKYLPAEFLKSDPDDVRPIMLFQVVFEKEEELRRAFGLLSKNGNPCAGLRTEPHAVLSCDVIDLFGVFWYLYVPKDFDAPYVHR
ncbi:MAG: hypothetical protein LBB75_05070 [Oscillospiraceae bacterium]|jgi:uncharacterized glyoxalase superfamily protein PhnB|nr:hypothetical protein [Oscillospiraceae bacterium]